MIGGLGHPAVLCTLPLGHLTGAYSTSLMLRPNSSLHSELRICPNR